jgi:hypothetical protein
MFRAIVSMDLSQLLQLGQKFCSNGTNIVAAVLCFDHAFRVGPSHQTTALSGEQATTNLPAFFNYTRVLKQVALELDPSEDPAVQNLLGIQLRSSDEFFISNRTELHSLLKRSPMQSRKTNDGMAVPRAELRRVVKASLLKRLEQTLGTVERIKDWPFSASVLFIR